MRDPQKLSGNQTYPRFRKCTCGHDYFEHDRNKVTGVRTWCMSWHGGKCRCQRYEAES